MKIHAGMKLLSLTGILVFLLAGCSSDDTALALRFYFKASNSGTDDLFGKSVAISGDGKTMAVGAWGEDSNGSAQSNNDELAAGAVYVYKREVTGGGVVGWRQVAYVKASSALSPAAGDNFGFSVAISENGNILAVGAPGADVGLVGNNEGAVFVYSGPNYDTATVITAPDLENDDRFGESVALSGDGLRLAVGASLEDGGAGDPNPQTGAIYVYTDGLANGTSWTIETTLYAPTMQNDANLGVSVALNQDGSILAAGAWLENDIGTDEGAAYVFTRTAGAPPTWSAGVQFLASDGATDDRFGSSVALNDNGDRLAVGAPGDFLGLGGFTGQVYIFTNSGGWSQEAIISASNGDADDAFGISVALNGNGETLLVGAPYEKGSGSYITTPDMNNTATGAGAAYRFTRSAGPPVSWTEKQYIKATNTDAGDQFGTSVSISDNGLRIVMGAPAEQSLAVGINGNQADDSGTNVGAAYLYNL